MCLKVLQSEHWPAGGAGLMVTGAGFTTGRTVVCRGWMMIVLACKGAAAWASGTAVISGFGWMETFGPIWIGFLTGWAGLAGVCKCDKWQGWMDAVRQQNRIHRNILSAEKEICIYSYWVFLKEFILSKHHHSFQKCGGRGCLTSRRLIGPLCSFFGDFRKAAELRADWKGRRLRLWRQGLILNAKTNGT